MGKKLNLRELVRDYKKEEPYGELPFKLDTNGNRWYSSDFLKYVLRKL